MDPDQPMGLKQIKVLRKLLGNSPSLHCRPLLFKTWITLSTEYFSIQWITQLVIHWIVNYLSDRDIQLFEKLGLRVFCRCANIFARINAMLKNIVVKVLGQG